MLAAVRGLPWYRKPGGYLFAWIFYTMVRAFGSSRFDFDGPWPLEVVLYRELGDF
ncbi:MAG: hypothetical protein GWN58_48050 [Anaerolineae bacterium]|nr:hypothetical protein [Anaerolineae bacterium]